MKFVNLAPGRPTPGRSLHGQTLQDVLLQQHIPDSSFNASELQQKVTSIVLGGPPVTEIVYQASEPTASSDSLIFHLVRFNTTIRAVLRGRLLIKRSDVCAGALNGMMLAGDFTLVSTHISPSADCLFVLNSRLQRTETLYGFGPLYLGQDRIVLIEDMVHFAPVHPKRLQLVNLKNETTTELYPPKDDPLRAKLTRKNASNMPPPRTCELMNDPCDPKLFDETVIRMTAGPESQFTFIVRQSASHTTKAGQPPIAAGSQSVLYIYEPREHGWIYCEEEIGEAEANELTKVGLSSWYFQNAQGRCSPSVPVIPDMSAALMNPFLHRTRH